MDEFLIPDASYNRLIKEYKQYNSLIICVDFDNTIFDYHGHGATYKQVQQLVRDLKSINCEIIIWTGNQDLHMVKKYLADNEIPYDLINEDSDIAKKHLHKAGHPVPRKVFANCYLDDRGGLLQCYVDLKRVYTEVITSK